jgi:predicted signal transduction protein with EAL and GGDEF domain
MFEAKQQGRGSYRFYGHTLNHRTTHRIALANRLRKALQGDELTVLYQPEL